MFINIQGINKFSHGEKKGDIMGISMDRIATYEAQNHQLQFMKVQDYATRTTEAKQIHEFLNNKDLQAKRQEELAAYLLGMRDENGNRKFTYKDAVAAAKEQVENEKSQMNAQITKVFIDKESYDKAVAEAKKNGDDKIYNFNLIEDENLLAYIKNNPEKFCTTDDAGKLVFDSDKFKAEFGQDVGTDNKLQLKEREDNAERRTISKTAEKNAIKAAGLDYKRDNTGLYRTLAASAALASLVVGFAATAEASAGAALIGSHAKASAWGAGVVGAAATGATIPFLHDKDRKTNKRQNAADLFAQKPTQQATLPKVEGVSITGQTNPLEINPPEIQIETPCYNVIKGVPVKTIKFGGYWHYANLYNDCNTGKPLNKAQLAELTQLLKPGHEGSSMQKGDSLRTKNLIPEITLKDGTKVCLADAQEIERRVAQMKTKDGKQDLLRPDGQRIVVTDCNGNFVRAISQ